MSVLHLFHVQQNEQNDLAVNVYLKFWFVFLFHLHDDKALNAHRNPTRRGKVSHWQKKTYTSSPFSRDSSVFLGQS